MLSKSLLLAACLLFSSSNSVVKGQIITNTTLQNTTTSNNSTTGNNNSTISQQELNCTVQSGDLPELQVGLNNFVIDMLDTFPFPFALNQCTSASLLPSTTRYMYQCTNSAGTPTVIKTQYNNTNCTGSGTVVEQFSETNATNATGAKGYFDCSGFDTYVQIEFSWNSTCGSAVSVYGALGSCSSFMNSSSNPLQMNMYCDNTGAVMQIFNLMNSLNATNSSSISQVNATLPSLLNQTSSSSNQSMMCTDDTFCDKWTITSQCNMITSFPLLGNNQTLYGRLLGCIVDLSMSTTELMSTTNLNLSSINSTTGATGGGSSTTSTSILSTMMMTTSSAIRPSFLFASSLLLLLSFFSI